MSFQDLPVSTPHPSTGVAAQLLYPSFHVGARDQNSGPRDYELNSLLSPVFIIITTLLWLGHFSKSSAVHSVPPLG